MLASYLRKRREEAFLGEALKGHPEEIDIEFPVDVVELVITLAIR